MALASRRNRLMMAPASIPVLATSLSLAPSAFGDDEDQLDGALEAVADWVDLKRRLDVG